MNETRPDHTRPAAADFWNLRPHPPNPPLRVQHPFLNTDRKAERGEEVPRRQGAAQPPPASLDQPPLPRQVPIGS